MDWSKLPPMTDREWPSAVAAKSCADSNSIMKRCAARAGGKPTAALEFAGDALMLAQDAVVAVHKLAMQVEENKARDAARAERIERMLDAITETLQRLER